MTVVPELRAALIGTAEEHLNSSSAPASMRAPSRMERLRRRLRRGGLPLAVALVSASGGVAAATGFVVSQATKDKAAALVRAPAPTPEHPGRFSKLGAQMVRAAKEVQATLPYPPGMHDTYDWSRYSAGATLGTGGETRREIQLMSEFRAQCLWRRYYLEVHDAGNRPAMRDAAAILAQVPNWSGSRSMSHPGDDDPNSYGAALRAFARAAANGEATSAMRNDVEINCYDHTKAELTGKVPLVRHSGG